MAKWTVGWKVRGEYDVNRVDVDDTTSAEAIAQVKASLDTEKDQIVALIVERI
ncbi:hypothetical protein [Schumannella soli]|uniref:hypothetical protein n=1 Tax=Schumannella soli TaxID=2590779 RepID=UPI0015E87755|nr:hypothetical protein [Schumannella soli]